MFPVLNDKILTKLIILSLIIFLIAGNCRFLYSQPIINNIIADSDTVGKYDKFELTVDLTTLISNPYDFEKINLQCVFVSPSGFYDTVDGFYYQDYVVIAPDELEINGPPVWKIRFTPYETGN